METGYTAAIRTFAAKTYLHIFLIVMIGVIAYSNTFHVPFVFDDTGQIENNRMIKDLHNFLSALKGQEFDAPTGYLYVPTRFVGYLSFALNYRFGGADVSGYHLVNLLIHIANAILVYFFVKLTFGTPVMQQVPSLSPEDSHGPSEAQLIALFSSLLFVSHPVQTQAVTYTVQRFTSLATMFYLLSIVFYIKARLSAEMAQACLPVSDSDLPPAASSPLTSRLHPVAFYAVSLVCAVLALTTKEIAFTLPLIIILYESAFFRATARKKLLFISSFVLILLIAVIGIMQSGKPLADIISDLSEKTRLQTRISRWDYLMTEMRVITTYIRLIFMPVKQNLDYDYHIYDSLLTPSVFLSFLFLLAVFGAAFWFFCRSRQGANTERQEARGEGQGAVAPRLSPAAYYRLAAFGIFWFFITMSVESSVIPIVDVIFEHRVYLPSVGLLTAITAVAFVSAKRLKKEMAVLPILALIILALSAAAFARNRVWNNGTTLWEDVVEKSPEKARPHNNLGEFYYTQGRLARSMEEFQTALRIDPNHPVAHNNMGSVFAAQGLMLKAIEEYRIAVGLRPDYADAHYNLGQAYLLAGKIDEAINHLAAAARLNPLDPDYSSRLSFAIKLKNAVPSKNGV